MKHFVAFFLRGSWREVHAIILVLQYIPRLTTLQLYPNQQLMMQCLYSTLQTVAKLVLPPQFSAQVVEDIHLPQQPAMQIQSQT